MRIERGCEVGRITCNPLKTLDEICLAKRRVIAEL